MVWVISGVLLSVVLVLFLVGFDKKSKAAKKRLYRNKINKTQNNEQAHNHTKPAYRFKPKPQWVKDEIIRLKALMPEKGCRKISDAFNRLHNASRSTTVGKTYVANVIREHQYQIRVVRNKIKHKPPRHVPRQLIWGIDLTFKTDTEKQTHAILGIIEHHSRKSLALEALKDKATTTLLRCLFIAIEQYGKPKIIRTDNEGIFTSRLFSLTVWLLGIKHQTTELHSPWQNGRVERFFGTLKQKINRWSVTSFKQCNHDLQIFQFWYNKVRTHNNLNGKTPEEAWLDIDIFKRAPENIYYFNEWDGLLTGFYHPP